MFPQPLAGAGAIRVVACVVAPAVMLFTSAACAQGERHQHGASTLEISLEKNTLAIRWESPLNDLIGFEHAPRSAKEKAAAQNLLSLLDDPSSAFKPNSEAMCRMVAKSITAPNLSDIQTKHTGDASTHDHDHAVHSDLDYSVTYHCSSPDALSQLNIRALTTWPAIKDIDASLVGPGGQASQEANQGAKTIDLKTIAVAR